jgi:hypothetical protein
MRPLFGTPSLLDVMDFERAGNSVLLNRLPLRRHGHDIDRTQYATRQEIYALRPRLRRHLRLSRHRHHGSTSPKDMCQCRFCCLCCVCLNKLDRPFGYQMSLRDCSYRYGCVCHAFENRGPQSTIFDVTMICVGCPYGRVRCVDRRHQTSVYTVELSLGKTTSKSQATARNDSRPRDSGR